MGEFFENFREFFEKFREFFDNLLAEMNRIFEYERNLCFCQDFGLMEKEGGKFKSLKREVSYQEAWLDYLRRTNQWIRLAVEVGQKHLRLAVEADQRHLLQVLHL